MHAKVYLTRRNLRALISKLDRKRRGEKTACTIVKNDNLHDKYPQTMKTLSVVGVEDGSTFTGTKLYLDRHNLKALISALDQKKAGVEVACVTVIKETNPKKAPKTIEVFVLEDEEYYTGRRLAGEIYYADDPTNLADQLLTAI